MSPLRGHSPVGINRPYHLFIEENRMNLTIKMNASTDAVTIDGHTFDRSILSPDERATMARMVVDAMVQAGDIKTPRRRHRRKRRKAHTN